MQDKSNDGGPAFPSGPQKLMHIAEGVPPALIGHYGMSLRDWYAGMALQGLLSNSHPNVVKAFAKISEIADDAFAESAYAFADAMIKQREMKGNNNA